MINLSVSERIQIYSRYVGQSVVLKTEGVISEEQVATLTGIKSNAIQIELNSQFRWIPLYEDFQVYDIKLVLKPLSQLTSGIKEVANNLPIQNFITQYYIKLGFDMPVFIAPDHPANCKYVEELGLAVYSVPAAAADSLSVVEANS
jgi:hypothetical protein